MQRSTSTMASNGTSVETEEKCFKTIAESSPPLFQNGKIVLQAYHIGWIISGFFTLVAVIVSLWLIRKHLQWYTNKREQRYIVRLLFMVPLYAVISFASFIFWNHSTPIILIRDAYEAIVLTAFFYLLLMYLSHDPEEQKRVFLRAGLSLDADIIALRNGQEPVKWVFPLGFAKWKPRDGLYFLQLMKWGVLQYCVIRPTSTLAAVVLNYLGLYCEDSWGLGWGHIYITIVMSVSVTIAMYCLLQLYFPVAKDLAPYQPLLKLFSVKAVVFLTFWQATFLSMLSLFGVVKDTKYMTADDVNNAIGAILETFEMMLFAFLHIKAFSYKPYAQASKGVRTSQTPQWRSLGHAMNFRETFGEIWIGCVYMFDSMRGREPTPDFGVIRESHYATAFGRERPVQGSPHQLQPGDHTVRVTDLTYPALEIEVDQEVEVIVNGKREWLFLEKYDQQRRGPLSREKSEGLQEQINRELARRGYDNQGLMNSTSEKDRLGPETQSGGQTSWWRNIYNRISQTGYEPDEDEKQPFRRRKTLRSHRHHRSHSLQHYPDINEQPPKGLLYPHKPRPSESLIHEEYDEVLPRDDHDGDDRRPSFAQRDSRRASQFRHEHRSIPVPSSPHTSQRNSRPSKTGATLAPTQLGRSPPALHSLSGDSGPSGPTTSSPSPLITDKYLDEMQFSPLVPSLSAPRFPPYQSPPKGPAEQTSTQKLVVRPGPADQGAYAYSAFPWSPPPAPPNDVTRNATAETDSQRVSHQRRKGAGAPRGRRVNAWLRSIQPFDSNAGSETNKTSYSVDHFADPQDRHKFLNARP